MDFLQSPQKYEEGQEDFIPCSNGIFSVQLLFKDAYQDFELVGHVLDSQAINLEVDDTGHWSSAVNLELRVVNSSNFESIRPHYHHLPSAEMSSRSEFERYMNS